MAPTVVVTGLGIVSPIGIGIGEFWKNAVAGRSGITKLRSFEHLPAESYRSRIAGQVPDFDPQACGHDGLASRVDRYAQFGLAAAKEAVADAGLKPETKSAERIGVMGEGAGALILETLQHAKRRNAGIYREIAGYASTSEAHHMIVPKEDGTEIAKTMTLALHDANIRPAQVDYVNTHATSTMIGDEVEVRGIRRVFKRRADKLLISATKSLIGHTMARPSKRNTHMTALSPSGRQIQEALAIFLQREPDTIKPEHHLREDLGLDSLMTFELLYELEKTFGLEIPNENLPGLQTLADIVSYVEAKVPSARTPAKTVPKTSGFKSKPCQSKPKAGIKKRDSGSTAKKRAALAKPNRTKP